MSSWSQLEAAYDLAAQAVFGEPITYQDPAGQPVTLNTAGNPLTGIRLQRSRDEIEQAGPFEGLDISEADFATGPSIGSWVTLDGVQYVIADIRDPHPFDGKKTLVLNRRTRQAPNA